jgi:hypothetical protein
MLFTSPSELRFYFPTHAIDTLDPFMGVIDNSEHDFLQEKLGTPLYDRLCDWYDENGAVGSGSAAAIDTKELPYYNRLLLLAQRCVAYDAFARAIELGIVSPNNGGINVPTSDDYGKVDLAAIEKFRQRCVIEAHVAINRLLQTLEDWCKESEELKEKSDASSDNSQLSIIRSTSGRSQGENSQLQEIVTLWHQSRYFYLAAGMLIPSARVLQEYFNIYDSREKFIQMLPDLRFLQEEILAPAIGEDLCAYLVEFATTGKIPNTEETAESADTAEANTAETNYPLSTIHYSLNKSRKYLAAALENRTLVLKTDKLRRQQAHDEAVRLFASLQQYIAAHQDAFPEAVIKTSPLYTPPPAEAAPTPSSDGSSACCGSAAAQKEYRNNRRDSALFVTPFLN